MAFNVWYRIWPAQQKIITAVKDGTPPDAALVVPRRHPLAPQRLHGAVLLWTMINQHTTTVPAAARHPGGVRRSCCPCVVILVGWHLVWQLYSRAGKVKGF